MVKSKLESNHRLNVSLTFFISVVSWGCIGCCSDCDRNFLILPGIQCSLLL